MITIDKATAYNILSLTSDIMSAEESDFREWIEETLGDDEAFIPEEFHATVENGCTTMKDTPDILTPDTREALDDGTLAHQYWEAHRVNEKVREALNTEPPLLGMVRNCMTFDKALTLDESNLIQAACAAGDLYDDLAAKYPDLMKSCTGFYELPANHGFMGPMAGTPWTIQTEPRSAT